MDTKVLIRSHFQQLHQILNDEESRRLAAVRKEEEEKIAGMKDKEKELSAELVSLADTISLIEEQLQEEDVTLLKVCCKHLKHVSSLHELLLLKQTAASY